MIAQASNHSLGIVRVAAAGAAAAVAFFVLCWVGSFLPLGPASHRYLLLFTDAEAASGLALAQGICWSVAFGLLAGGLFALFYNLLAGLDKR